MSDTAKDQAIAQANSIANMVYALSVDYDRMEHLRDEFKEYSSAPSFSVEFMQWNNDYAEEYADLVAAANGNTNEDEAREAIQNDALDVQVRTDWYSAGLDNASVKPSEFYILLCTGGPAVRIMGELDECGNPCRAWIEYQDWGTPWTQLFGEIEQSTLLAYCQEFYFGE